MAKHLIPFAWYVIAAFAEIGGCFAFWMWLRQGKSALWVIPGMCLLAVFAAALTRIDTPYAGRAYAAYGGIYILCSIIWLSTVEKIRPDRWDLIGAAICIIGAAVILFIPRHEMVRSDNSASSHAMEQTGRINEAHDQ